MMRSMFAGVGGLRVHQERMDVIGNNIANVNTVGFKKGRMTFEDVFYQTLEGASAADENRGGRNPVQLGLGVATSGVDTIHTQGNLESTGVNTDLAVEGSGFFIVDDIGQKSFTRAGNFTTDSNGNLVNSSGLRVQGWNINQEGQIDTSQEVQGINLPLGEVKNPQATANMDFFGNLSAAHDDASFRTSLEALDSLGNRYNTYLDFEAEGGNTWSFEISINHPEGIEDIGDWGMENDQLSISGEIEFDELGRVRNIVQDGIEIEEGETVFNLPEFTPENAETVNLNIDFSGLTQFEGESFVDRMADGNQMGEFEDFTIDSSGVLTARFTNGEVEPYAQIALASFNNPSGLLNEGSNLFSESPNSGSPQIGPAETGARGSLVPGNIEMSNVDLAEEFTSMITTQRGYQANSRTITTADEMLQEVVNIRR